MAYINLGDGEYQPPDVNNDPGRLNPGYDAGQPSFNYTDPGARTNQQPSGPTNPFYVPGSGAWPGGGSFDNTGLWNAPAAAAQTPAAPDNHSRIDAALQGAKSSDDPNYWYGKIDSDPNGYGSAWSYWLDRINRGDGAQLGLPRFQDGGAAPTTTYGAPAGGNYTASNPFSDPATKGYIDLLNSRMQSLLTPQQNPQMDSLLQYMQKYFQQLQGPTYTDAQRATIQTQQLDPMERQRQARKQQVIQQMASRGMSPSDGPTVAALADVDRQYDTLRAQTQGGIANNEINLGRQNQAQAVDVGSAAASLVNGMNNQQDQRANQAVNYGRQIPDLAQSRLAQSIQLLNGNSVNPASLMNGLQGFQQQGLNQNSQDSQYWSSIINALAKAFGL